VPFSRPIVRHGRHQRTPDGTADRDPRILPDRHLWPRRRPAHRRDRRDGRTDVDAIHAEVYVDPSIFEAGAFPDLTPLVAALDLPFEPVLFVLDGTGTVVARLDTTFDRGELRDALALV